LKANSCGIATLLEGRKPLGTIENVTIVHHAQTKRSRRTASITANKDYITSKTAKIILIDEFTGPR